MHGRVPLAHQASKSLVREAVEATAAEAEGSGRRGRFAAARQQIRVPVRNRGSITGGSPMEGSRRGPATAPLNGREAGGSEHALGGRETEVGRARSDCQLGGSTALSVKELEDSRARRGSHAGGSTSILEPEGPYLEPELAEVAFDNGSEDELELSQPRHALGAGSLLSAPGTSAEHQPSWAFR
jgi:hypothetical protein